MENGADPAASAARLESALARIAAAARRPPASRPAEGAVQDLDRAALTARLDAVIAKVRAALKDVP